MHTKVHVGGEWTDAGDEGGNTCHTGQFFFDEDSVIATTTTTLFWPMAQSGLDLRIAAPGLALVNSIGNLGGFVSPFLFGYLKDTTGSTNGGLYTLTAASLLAVVAARYIRGARASEAPVVAPVRTAPTGK
jgi:nitrate/nitrite transporter NarK